MERSYQYLLIFAIQVMQHSSKRLLLLKQRHPIPLVRSTPFCIQRLPPLNPGLQLLMLADNLALHDFVGTVHLLLRTLNYSVRLFVTGDNGVQLTPLDHLPLGDELVIAASFQLILNGGLAQIGLQSLLVEVVFGTVQGLVVFYRPLHYRKCTVQRPMSSPSRSRDDDCSSHYIYRSRILPAISLGSKCTEFASQAAPVLEDDWIGGDGGLSMSLFSKGERKVDCRKLVSIRQQQN